MDTWQPETPAPSVKFEASPAESFLSVPGDMYPSLFGTPASTLNPLEIMTPQSFNEDNRAELAVVTGLAGSSEPPEDSPTDKKQTKKRKSWGQVLPEPKTNLPPRKRAKTEDEKEQRRVERVLRNRRAAQSSRERKRQEVDALELRNKELEAALETVRQANMVLCQELSKVRGTSGVIARNSVTFSQELFSSHDGHAALAQQSKPLLDELMMTAQTQTTINPTSLSPVLSPVPDKDEEEDVKEAADSEPAHPLLSLKASPDLTQHPAVSVGGSLSGLDSGAVAPVAASVGSLVSADVSLAGLDFDHGDFALPSTLDADSYVLESGLLASPHSSSSDYDCVAGDDTFPFPAPTDFDFDDFLNNQDDHPTDNGLDDVTLEPTTLADANPATQASPEDPNLQPHVGASTLGCDDGGLAVGAF